MQENKETIVENIDKENQVKKTTAPDENSSSAKAIDKNKSKKSKISKLAILDFILIILLSGVTGFFGYQFYNLSNKMAENAESSKNNLTNRLDKINADIVANTNQLNAYKQNLEQLQVVKEKLETELGNILKSRQENQRIRSIDWQFAEIEYLLRIANQELIIAQDKKLALRLMRFAHQKLNKLNLDSTLPISKALQADIQRLDNSSHKSLADISIELLGISASIEQMQQLNFLDATKKPSNVEAQSIAATDSEQSSFFEKIWQELKSLIIIRTNAKDIKPFIATEDFYLQKQRLLSLLNQASWASLHKNQALYEATINTSIDILQNHLSEYVNAKPIFEKLTDLKKLSLNIDEQSYSNALQELEEFLTDRYKLSANTTKIDKTTNTTTEGAK